MADTEKGFAPIFHSERLTFTLLSLHDQNDLNYAASVLNEGGAGGNSPKGFWDAAEMARLCYSIMLSPSDTFGVAIDEVPVYIAHLGSKPGNRIGLINLCRRTAEVPPDLGFGIDLEHRRNGYGTEATTRVLKYWTDEFGLGNISLVTSYKNIAAQKVARNAGFIDGGWVSFSPGGGKAMAFVLPGMEQLNGQGFKFWGDGAIPLMETEIQLKPECGG